MKKSLRRSSRLVATVLAGGFALSAGVASVSASTPAGDVERQPLTGVPIDGTLITYTPRPAMVVKIDNVENDGRNQTGLNQADVVFEEIVEGRATRFAAVFNSMDSNPVGPIRSGRTQDVTLLACLHDVVYVWSGGNAGVEQALTDTGWTLLGQGAQGMFRTDRSNPHDLFATMSELWPQAGDTANAVPIFEYIEPGAEVGGTPVTFAEMMVGGYDVRWDWDANAGLFMRSQLGEPHALTDGQASANSVVVLVVPYGRSGADSNSPEAETIGTGAAVVYTNGHKLEGTWTRENALDPFTLETSDGTPILLAPGRTWVELVDDQHQLGDG